MWDTTQIALLISMPVTLVIVLILYFFLRSKGAKMEPKGCGCGIIGLFYVVFLFAAGVVGWHNRSYEAEHPKTTTTVKLVNGGSIEVEDSLFLGNDITYIKSSNVYKNNTNRDLVEYMVKYTTSGTNSDMPIGILIKPGDYFFWHSDDNHRMFTSPPSSIMVRRRIGSGGMDFTYLHFLDYADNVKGTVRF